MATLTVGSIVPAGALRTLVAAGVSGDVFPDDGRQRTFLYVKNSSGGSLTVTVAKQQSTVSGVPGVGTITLADLTVTLANADEKLIGPFAPYLIDTSGNVNVTYSTVTTVTVQPLKLPAVI